MYGCLNICLVFWVELWLLIDIEVKVKKSSHILLQTFWSGISVHDRKKGSNLSLS